MAQKAANGPTCMSQATNPLRLGEFPFSIYSFLLSGVIRIGLPAWKYKKLKNLGNKIHSKGCKQSNLNVPGTQSTQFGKIPFPIFSLLPSWVKRIGLQAWKWKSWKMWETKLAQRPVYCPTWMPQTPNLLRLGEFPFPIFLDLLGSHQSCSAGDSTAAQLGHCYTGLLGRNHSLYRSALRFFPSPPIRSVVFWFGTSC